MNGILVFTVVFTVLVPIQGQNASIFETIRQYYKNRELEEEATLRYDSDIPLRAPETLLRAEYDFVVVGAGVAGSVVANRLSEIPQWTVLLLEAGGEEDFLTSIPAILPYFQSTPYNWGYSTEPQDKACLAMHDKRCEWPSGKGRGGTSILDYMVYTRGNKADYDTWAELGNPGWSYRDLLPYFIISENNHVPELQGSFYHGTGGYLNVESVPYRTPLAAAYLEAAKELGYDVGDYNGESGSRFSYTQVTQLNGGRHSSGRAFLEPAAHRRNLHIATRAQVTKIHIDPFSRTAYGVEFVKNNLTYTIRARKEVVLSAGTLNSPQLLMLSGVGPRDHLQELGIPVVKDLKVGHNLQGKLTIMGPSFLINESIGIVEDRTMTPANALEYVLRGKGPLTIPGGVEAVGRVRTPLQKTANLGPDIELYFGAFSVATDSSGAFKTGIGMTDEFFDKTFRPFLNKDAFTIFPCLVNPKSRGTTRLRSKDPFQPPLFYPNFYSDPRDIQVLVEGIKIAVALGNSTAFQKYGSKLFDLQIPGCETHPIGSDSYWECAVRYITIPVHSQVGTCKMGPRSDPDAVVDPELKVHGIRGLRVIDASIMPVGPTALTMATTYMIGEKGADLIKSTYNSIVFNRG